MKSTKNKWSTIILAVLTILFLFLFALSNLMLPKDAVGKWMRGEATFSEFTDQVHSKYVSDDLKAKQTFLNINGLFARLSGRRVYNEAVLLNNGMLSRQENPIELNGMGQGLAKFSEFVSEQGSQFLFVQAPAKIDLEGKLLPKGVTSYYNAAADTLVRELQASGVRTLDLRPHLSATPELVERHFFATDHHWNYTGAFVGFQKVTEFLSQMYPDRNVDLTYTQWEQWESRTLKDQFLGSIGKRVGKLYAGVDDLTYYVPAFETEMSCAIPKYRELYRGDFTAANIRQQYLGEKDYFGLNNYCAYIGGDYPLVQHRNAKAPSDLKVLMIKDSFTLPFQCYLSTIFQKLDVIDPRHYSETTLAQYIDCEKPDLVLMMINPTQLGTKNYWSIGAETLKKGGSERQMVLENAEIVLEPMDADYNFTGVPLDPGTRYTLAIDDVRVTQGQTDGTVAALYNATKKQLLCIHVFDLEYGRQTGGFEWTFQTPHSEDELQLLFYAGTHGHNRNNGLVYQGVDLAAFR